MYFGIAILLALVSITIVWSESTFGISIGDDKHLSIIANLVYHGHMNNNYAIVEVRDNFSSSIPAKFTDLKCTKSIKN